jgi:hypothetical protein
MVVKHEAMAIRHARQGWVEHDDVDFDAALPSGGRDVEDHVAGGERVERSVEALRALKPDEAKALMLKAEGLSYNEIGRRFGWTYTKVNRSITEGRARFMKGFRRFEAGDACEAHAEALAAVAAGAATATQVLELRPHLRHCAACRAAIRELRLSRRRRVALLTPLPLLRALRHHAFSLYNRISDPTPLAGVRPGAVAAALAGCIAVGGGATYCVNQHVDPLTALSAFSAPDRHRARPKPRATPRPRAKRARVARVVAPPPVATRTSTPTPTATATATPRPTPVATASIPVPTATAQARPPAPQDEFVPGNTTTASHAASPPKPKPAPAASGGGNEFSGP